MNFYETKMGRIFFEHHVPQLINAVNALTAVLSRPTQTADLSLAADPKFLRDLYFGSYEPGVYKVSPEIRQLDRAVSLAHEALSEMLSEEGHKSLDAYEAALSERNTAVIEQAYESGVRIAVQMIVAGLSQPAASQTNKSHESEEV